MGTHIHIAKEGALGILSIDRRERMNAMDVETAQDFRKAGLQLARDEAVRAVLVRGVGGVFCTGADLKYIKGGGDQDDLGYLAPKARAVPGGYGEVFKQILEYIHSTISEIKRAEKPFVAAVDGVAAAGGLGIALSCDVVVASERSWFEWAYGKTGLCGAESSTFFLPRLIGLRRALDLVFLNPRLDAQKALDWGMISAVLPTEGFDAASLALATRLAEGPTAAWAQSKSLMHQAAMGERLDTHLDRELEALQRSADSADFAEGLAAFFDKRPARFGGKH